MIHDDIKNHQLYASLHPLFPKAFEFLSHTDLNKLSLGKHAILDDELFVIIMEYETKEPEQGIMENHKRYIDIQYMIKGEELMGTKLYSGEIPSTAYDSEKEAAFYKPEFDSIVKVKEGQFTIFFPHDLHMPSMKSGNPAHVKKAVFKVRADKH